MNLRLPFEGAERLDKSYSGLGQDLFVLMLLDGLSNGTYLEVGANDPVVSNNTYLLEKVFGWTGLSVDISKVFERRFKLFRQNTFVSADARRIAYRPFFGSVIDYLSLDIDPPEQTYEALANILGEGLSFKVLTFEHDYYMMGSGPRVRTESRDLLESYGYELLVADVSFNGLRCEDWWINPDFIDPSRAAVLAHAGPIDFNDYISGTDRDG